MWQILFFLLAAQAAAPTASTLDFETFKTKVQPLFLEKRPGHARCSTCHARSTEETRKNFDMASKFVVPGVPSKSRLLTMPLAHEAGGTEFHPGGKHWESQNDPEWKALSEWVKNAAATSGRGLR